jgi:hypothetical protein
MIKTIFFGLVGLSIAWVINHYFGLHPAYSYGIGFFTGLFANELGHITSRAVNCGRLGLHSILLTVGIAPTRNRHNSTVRGIGGNDEPKNMG